MLLYNFSSCCKQLSCIFHLFTRVMVCKLPNLVFCHGMHNFTESILLWRLCLRACLWSWALLLLQCAGDGNDYVLTVNRVGYGDARHYIPSLTGGFGGSLNIDGTNKKVGTCDQQQP